MAYSKNSTIPRVRRGKSELIPRRSAATYCRSFRGAGVVTKINA